MTAETTTRFGRIVDQGLADDENECPSYGWGAVGDQLGSAAYGDFTLPWQGCPNRISHAMQILQLQIGG